MLEANCIPPSWMRSKYSHMKQQMRRRKANKGLEISSQIKKTELNTTQFVRKYCKFTSNLFSRALSRNGLKSSMKKKGRWEIGFKTTYCFLVLRIWFYQTCKLKKRDKKKNRNTKKKKRHFFTISENGRKGNSFIMRPKSMLCFSIVEFAKGNNFFDMDDVALQLITQC